MSERRHDINSQVEQLAALAGTSIETARAYRAGLAVDPAARAKLDSVAAQAGVPSYAPAAGTAPAATEDLGDMLDRKVAEMRGVPYVPARRAPALSQPERRDSAPAAEPRHDGAAPEGSINTGGYVAGYADSAHPRKRA